MSITMQSLQQCIHAHELMTCVKNKDRYMILLYLKGRRDSRPQELEELLGIQRNRLGDHLSKMLSLGILTKKEITHKVHLYSIDEGQLEQVMEGIRIMTMDHQEWVKTRA